MFGKGKKRKLNVRLAKHEHQIKGLENKINNLITCEDCKCLLDRRDAIEGKHKIKRRQSELGMLAAFFQKPTSEEYIHIPYYCKRCKPAKKPKKKRLAKHDKK